MELAEAIFNTASQNAELSDAIRQPDGSVGMYFGMAPRNAELPYIWFTMVSNASVLGFAPDSDVFDYTVQFSIETAGKSEVENSTIFAKLINVFDRAELEYETFEPVDCVRTGGTGPYVSEDGEGWTRTVDYRIRYQKPGSRALPGSTWRLTWNDGDGNNLLLLARSLEITMTAAGKPYNSSSTGGVTGRTIGPTMWEGTFECSVDSFYLIPPAGATINSLVMENVVDGTGFTGSVFIERWRITAEPAEMTSVTVDFSGIGELSMRR